jgi:hypothetical protein
MLQHSDKVWFSYKKGVEGLYEPKSFSKYRKHIWLDRYMPRTNSSWDKFMNVHVFCKDIMDEHGQHIRAKSITFTNPNEEI